MNNYDKKMVEYFPNMLKGIAMQAERLDGGRRLSLKCDDVLGIAGYGLALCGQISEAEKVSTEKLVVECLVGSLLFGSLLGLAIANLAKRQFNEEYYPHTIQPLQPPTISNEALENKIAALERLYHLR